MYDDACYCCFTWELCSESWSEDCRCMPGSWSKSRPAGCRLSSMLPDWNCYERTSICCATRFAYCPAGIIFESMTMPVRDTFLPLLPRCTVFLRLWLYTELFGVWR